MDTFDILVIILSSTLAIFLILAIIATSYLIKLLKMMNGAADSAKIVVQNVESITSNLKNVANGKIVLSAVTALFDKFKNHGGKKGRNNE